MVGIFLEFGYFYQVFHGLNHACNLGSVFHFLGAADFTEAKGLHRAFLPLGAVDNAFYEFDMDLRHLLSR
ncbi:hypothetical protein AM218_00970 [Hymenobacter sp. DG25A]|nr:hypothetical protein AM218_00970 [Hymenobacter sp. DG25A]